MTVTRTSLLFQLRTGANDATWREFVAVYQPLIRQTARQRGVPASDIDDIVQDVLVQVLRSISSFRYQRTRGRFRNWLRRITINKIHDARRRRSDTNFLEDPGEIPDNTGEDHWEREFRSRLVRCALWAVQRESEVRTWTCFAEHALKRRTAADVARELSLSENAVYVNCSRVLSRVRGFCARYGEDLAHGPCAVSE